MSEVDQDELITSEDHEQSSPSVPKVLLLETKEDALAAGIPEDVFDADVHLFNQTTVMHPPTIVANAGNATDDKADE